MKHPKIFCNFIEINKLSKKVINFNALKNKINKLKKRHRCEKTSPLTNMLVGCSHYC